MKRVNYIFSIAACLAALLTSCVKEEAYKLETLNLEVNVTRAGSESEQQGDQIEDVMIWAFKKSGGAVKNDADGWRTYTPTSDTYTSVTVHIPLPMCNGSADYRLVAIINKGKFGEIVDADGKELTLNGDTKYNDLINARFESDVVNANLNLDQGGNLSLGNPGTPAVMPVSHWCDVTVESDNTHTLTDNQYQCAKVDMPVFRAVAKTQLFVARNSMFQLEVHNVELCNAKAPNQGVVLAEAADGWKVVDNNDVPSWASTVPAFSEYTENYEKELIQSVYKISDTDNTFIYNDNSTLASAESGHGVAHYICGKVLYETADALNYTDTNYKTEIKTTDGSGYYYKITYKIGNNGTLQTRYVPLPPIVRNHDYQVRALIKEDGGIVVNYTVADWEEVSWDLAFDAAQHTSLLPSPKDTHTENEYYLPTVQYNANSEEGAAVFYFKMTGPEGITWKPTIFANEDDFEVRVYKVGTDSTTGKPILDSEQTTGDIVAEGSTFYAVKVVAMKPTVATDYESVRLGITHAPQWNEEKPNLLIINPKSNGKFLWPKRSVDTTTTYTEGDEFYVEIYPE
ncbi:MAG: hypothetical protein IJ378_06250 [Alistipes sp.]|nr:hypothetical protein [Alistipes sp.]